MKVNELLVESKPIFNDTELSKKDERRFRKALKTHSGENNEKEAIDKAIQNLKDAMEKRKERKGSAS